MTRTTRVRLAFNALPLSPHGAGVATYIRELLAQLSQQVDASIRVAVQANALSELPPSVEPLTRPVCAGWRRALFGAVGFGQADLVHGLDVDLPLGHYPAKVSTVHDLAVFDQPQHFPRWRVLGERLLVSSSLRRADAIISVSAFTAERVRALLGLESSVVHEAPSPDMIPPSERDIDRVRVFYNLPDRFVLHVGTIEPRKDIGTIAAACHHIGVRLVLAGGRLWRSSPDLDRSVVKLGHVARNDLPALFGAATIVAYASKYEGFGLPPIEAMACGATVVTTRVPAVAEVVGATAETFDYGDVEGLGSLLQSLFNDSERRLAVAESCRRKVASLSWERTAAETAQTYRGLGLTL